MPKKKQRKPGLFNTKTMRSKKEVEKSMLGELPNDGRDWTDVEIDTFFDLWFSMTPIKVVCKETGRGYSAISTIAWKVATQYRGLIYTPGPGRVQRKGKPFNTRERAFAKLCRNAGRPTSVTGAWLCRPAAEVKGMLK